MTRLVRGGVLALLLASRALAAEDRSADAPLDPPAAERTEPARPAEPAGTGAAPGARAEEEGEEPSAAAAKDADEKSAASAKDAEKAVDEAADAAGVPARKVERDAPPAAKAKSGPGEEKAAGPKAERGGAPEAPADAGPQEGRPRFSVDPVEILGEAVEPGRRLNLTLRMGESFAGAPMEVPVSITHGTRPGPVVCLVAGIHGDELNGVEIVRRTVNATSPRRFKGTLVGLPIANLHGLQRGSRYLPDRRDLNRHFPGSKRGSAASRIADVLFRRIIRRCDLLVDFHTGSLRRTNLPQLRADLGNPAVADLAVRFGDVVVVNHPGRTGTLRRAATDIGIAAVTYEAGEPLQLDEEHVRHGVEKVRELLAHIDHPTEAHDREGLVWRSRWVRVDQGGFLLSRVELGQVVEEGEVLGIVTNPLTSEEVEVVAPTGGRVIGMALNQVVIPGYAAYHLGLEEGGDPAAPEAPRPAPTSDPPDDDAS